MKNKKLLEKVNLILIILINTIFSIVKLNKFLKNLKQYFKINWTIIIILFLLKTFSIKKNEKITFIFGLILDLLKQTIFGINSIILILYLYIIDYYLKLFKKNIVKNLFVSYVTLIILNQLKTFVELNFSINLF